MTAEKSFDCSVETISNVRKWIGEALAAERTPQDVIDAVLLAVSEAATNAVVHGYADTRRGRLDVRVSVDGASLGVTVRDYGAGFGKKQYTPPDTSLAHEGGYGVFLLRNLMDEVEVQTLEDGTEVRMKKTFKPGSAA